MATWVGAAVVGVGALVALVIPPKRRTESQPVAERDDELVAQLEAA